MKKIGYLFITFLFISLLAPARVTYGEFQSFKAAIIIDDFGGGAGGVKEFLEGNIPITAAVMPYTKKSTEHAEWAHKNGIEVMIHLPMEPKRGKRSWLGPKPITTDLSPQEVKERVYDAIKTVPYAKGINNHMGSLAIEKEEIVRAIVEVAKEKHLFIVDSGTSPDSKFPEITKELGVPFLKRDIFLDDISSASYVRKQMTHLAKITEIKGHGIAIGHVGVTGRVCSQGILQSMNEFKKRNIQIVPVSALFLLN
jgi:uncharacterized protein